MKPQKDCVHKIITSCCKEDLSAHTKETSDPRDQLIRFTPSNPYKTLIISAVIGFCIFHQAFHTCVSELWPPGTCRLHMWTSHFWFLHHNAHKAKFWSTRAWRLCEDSDVIVFYQNLKRTNSYVNIITNHDHIMWKKEFFVFTLVKRQLS